LVSPTVKVEAYRLARNGDIYQANAASATVISPSGLLLTNSHVVLDYQDDAYDVFAVCLSFKENEEPVCEYSAFLVGYDKYLDLALLQFVGLDNRGGSVPALPYLDYNFSGEATVGQPLDVYGYSDIGGKTLTRTRGQLSGFEDKNGVAYYKTDTDISGGNSGGTALDAEGNFIGVPTYIVSSYENLGYVLDIKAAVYFIEQYRDSQPTVNEQAYEILKVKKNVINDAKDDNVYTHPYYPKFSLAADENWQWDNISKTGLRLLYESNEGTKDITIEIQPLPFKTPQSYLDEAVRKLGLINEYLTDFKQEATTMAGQPATHISYNYYSQQLNAYIIPYGYAVFNIIYYVNLDQADQDLADINNVLETLTFKEPANDQPQVIETLAKSDPAFTIGRAGDWYILRNADPLKEDLIATYHNPADVVGEIDLSYQEIDDDFKAVDNAGYLDLMLKGHETLAGFKLINKNSALTIDNLSGWSLTYSYEGEESQEVRKVSTVFLRDGEHNYTIIYDDLLDNYNRYLNDFKQILLSFKNHGQPEDRIGRGRYDIGSLDYVFSDITYHRYEQAIANLADRGVAIGYGDGTFRPEKLISAAEVKSYLNKAFSESKRTQINRDGAGFLQGTTVTLADGLKALAESFELNLWQDKYNDAVDWKPYLDKGLAMNLLPAGLLEPQRELTRGEFTYMLYRLLESFELI